MTRVDSKKTGKNLLPESETLPQCCKQIAPVDPPGTLEKALERNLSNVKHPRPLPLLDLTLSEVLNDSSNSNKIRIPRRWKCLRRVCPMQH
jgi:hypothetical protein